ncbi:MAG: class I poly(R)-hydroxyalkanoic acid synthase [Candidatus Eremiobacteraeota bacterium]|nr:class I poly(R)-hydroxyalkanoic acid synthase [Candidatus Eremiobacteraeota bacterium]
MAETDDDASTSRDDAATTPRPSADALDPLGVNKATWQVWQAMVGDPQKVLQSQVQLANAWANVAMGTLRRSAPALAEAATANGAAPKVDVSPVIAPAPGDNRWKHPAWSDNPLFDALKQGYLLATRAVLDGIESAPGVDVETKTRVKFFAKQFCDAMSPTNFAFLNPAVIEETINTGGANLQKGAQNVLADLRDNSGRPALVDKAAFTVGKNVATTPGAVVFRNELIELIQYKPTTKKVYATPLLIVPPWINKFYILDLQPKNSLIKFALDNGIQVFVVSWRNPGPSLGHLGFDDYLTLGPLAAGDAVRRIAQAPTLNQIGYCIGGTLTAMELAYLAQTDPALVGGVTFFAALIDFAEAGDLKNFLGAEAVAYVEQRMTESGVLAGSDMADTFNLLRANDLIWNVAVNRYLLGKDAPAFDLLYWNSDATRMPAAMHAYYLKNMYLRNALALGKLDFKGVPIDLRTVRNDVYAVASIEDHIAPWRSVYKMTQMFSGDTKFRLGHSGHIAGIINPPSGGKGNYWRNDANPPAAEEWLAGAEKSAGSWWPDWMTWLQQRSGKQVPAPAALGSADMPSLEAAPGTYVLEKA